MTEFKCGKCGEEQRLLQLEFKLLGEQNDELRQKLKEKAQTEVKERTGEERADDPCHWCDKYCACPERVDAEDYLDHEIWKFAKELNEEYLGNKEPMTDKPPISFGKMKEVVRLVFKQLEHQRDVALKNVDRAQVMLTKTELGQSKGRIVHILHQGRQFCGKFAAPPASWPEGHLWVPLEKGNEATCPECVLEFGKELI